MVNLANTSFWFCQPLEHKNTRSLFSLAYLTKTLAISPGVHLTQVNLIPTGMILKNILLFCLLTAYSWINRVIIGNRFSNSNNSNRFPRYNA